MQHRETVGIGGVLVLVVGLAACSSETTPSPFGPGEGGQAGAAGGGTAGQGASAGMGGSGASGGGASGGASSECALDGFSANTQLAEYSAKWDYLYYEGERSITIPVDALTFELFYEFGADDGPHSHVFSGENYDACHTCAIMYERCFDPENCERTFLAVSGTLEVTAQGVVGDQLTGTLTDVSFREVTIDWDTFHSTPVVDGDVWCLDSFAFDTTIQTPSE